MIDLVALEKALRKGHGDQVVALYRGASEADRKETRPLIRALEKEVAAYWRSDMLLRRCPVDEHALAIAQLATTPSPEGAARALRWRTVAERPEVIVDRSVRWKRQLAELLTTISPSPDGGFMQVEWRFVDPLLAHLGIRHLDTPDYAVHWLSRQDVRRDADAQLAVDPDTPTLVMQAFDADRLHDAVPSHYLVPHAEGRERRWAEMAARWADAGLLDRAVLHERVLSCLIRGGMQPHLRAALSFLEELGPTPAEVRARQRDYLALLESPQSFVARHALAALRAADADDPLPIGVIADAGGIVLARADTALPQAALAWLKAALRRDPASADAVVRAAAVGLAHPKRAVQEKALALIDGVPAASAEVSWALDAVSPTIRGSVGTSPVLPELPPLHPVPPLRRVESVDELIDLARRVVNVGPAFGDDERLLHGFATFGAVLTKSQREALPRDQHSSDALHELLRRTPLLPEWVPRFPPRRRETARLGALRARDVVRGIGQRALHVSFPRDQSGLLDPDRLLDDLRRAAAEHRPIGPLDLEAAWLRLPLALGPDFASRVAAIGSEAARWLGGQLRPGPLAGPELAVNVEPARDPLDPLSAVAVIHTSWPAAEGRGGALLQRCVDHLWAKDYAHMQDVTILPTQREAIAVGDLGSLSWWHGDQIQTAPLTLLPHQQGALGVGTYLALARAATEDQAQLRAATTDAVLGLLATGALDGNAAGQAWAQAAHLPGYKLGRWLGHLRDVAASSMAGSRYVWAVLRQVVPVLFAPEASRRPGVADLVGLAAEAALTVGASDPVPGLDEVAARKSQSRLVVEARRLRAVLKP